ncbi:PH domain-containing protein [Flavobacterium sp. ZS1P14]|uniref:PH domain-containing protein n=1 Tax=Flavobacterium sp. ZS1P14 TaxID=3401729 RepID=UPI003AAAA671
MRVDFSQPQRQSVVGVLVLFFDTVRHFGKALWPILVVWFFKFKELNPLYLIVGVLSVFLIFGIIAYLKYLNFTFFLDKENQEFVITEGVLNKTKTTIQLNKIQQVTIRQSFVQKIIGVHALDVDTAGATKTEVAIKAISHDLALELKAHLLENETNKTIVVSDEIHAEIQGNTIGKEGFPFIKISFLSLLKVGISTNYVKSFFILLAFFFTLYDNIKRIFGESSIDESKIDSYFKTNVMTEVIPIAVLMLFLVILAMNVIRMVFKYFDFRITKQIGSLLLSFGLLNTKSTIIKPEKVQIVAVSSNYFQKKMNILEMKIKQATSGERQERKSVIEIPGCNEFEHNEILKLLFNIIPEKGAVLKPNFRTLGFSIFLTIGLPLFVFYFLRDAVVLQFPTLDILAAFYVVFVGVIQFFKYRNSRLFINDHFVIKQSGAWDISNEIIEPSKIQAITTSQLFWHKNLNIGSITLHTAGGNITFQLGDYVKIKQYVNLWLYEIETSDSNWM